MRSISGWHRTAPIEAGYYWYRESQSGVHRIVRLGYPGRSKELMDCHARAGDPMRPADMLDQDPHGAFYFPALEAP